MLIYNILTYNIYYILYYVNKEEEGRGGIETEGKGKEGRSKKITGYKFPNLLHVQHCTFQKN